MQQEAQAVQHEHAADDEQADADAGVFAFVVSSAFARAISERTSRVACSDKRSTSCPTVGFCSSGGMRPSIQSLISQPFRR